MSVIYTKTETQKLIHKNLMKSPSSNENKAKTQKIENGWMILSSYLQDLLCKYLTESSNHFQVFAHEFIQSS
jgi:hypothetical protein